MINHVLKRKDVPITETWDLTDLVPNEEAYNAGIQQIIEDAKTFNDKYQDHITDAQQIVNVITDYEALITSIIPYDAFMSLDLETDQTNDAAQIRASKFGTFPPKSLVWYHLYTAKFYNYL